MYRKSKYKHLFFDLDNTLIDFDGSAKIVLEELFEEKKLDRYFNNFASFYMDYSHINKALWHQYKDHLITKDAVKYGRFEQTLATKEVVDSAVDLFKNDSVILKKNYAVDFAKIFADKNQMISVFNNLVKNALQAIEELENPKLSVTISKENDFYLVQIEDNGVGIPDAKKHKVFVPNFTTKSSGTGLGLAISKQIIEGIGGSIWFESVENNFTIFNVKIPIKK